MPFALSLCAVFERIPVSLEEAARVDGCNKCRPVESHNSSPISGIVAVFVFAFIGAWNDLVIGHIYIQCKLTIPVGMKSLIGKYNVNWGELMAGGVLAYYPRLCLHCSKYVVEGLTAGQ